MIRLYDERDKDFEILTEDIEDIIDYLGSDLEDCKDYLDIDDKLSRENGGCAGYRCVLA